MSLRIVVALAATIGAGALISTAAEARPDIVGFHGDYSPGTIVVKTNERRLYLVVEQGRAVRYPVGVGRAGKQWAGTTRIDGKYQNPAWSPPSEVRRDKPSMPDVIPGGSGVGRWFCLLWLHPHAERRYHRPVPARLGRHHRGGCALIDGSVI